MSEITTCNCFFIISIRDHVICKLRVEIAAALPAIASVRGQEGVRISRYTTPNEYKVNKVRADDQLGFL